LIAAEEPAVTQPTEQSEVNKEPEPVTAWGCIQTLIVLIIAGSITGYLGIYLWGWLPSGLYSVTLLILIFIPPAIVGVASGLGVLWFINLFIPGAFTKDSSNAGIHKDEVMTTQSFTQSND
jgi:hypothetical protein